MTNEIKPKRKMGRPPTRPQPLDPGIVERICDGLIAGQGLETVCRPKDMPDMMQVYRMMAKDEEFARKIARARQLQQDAMVDQTVAMADAATPEDYNVVKLRIWARQWRAGKLAPRKYGEKVAVTGADGGNPVLEVVKRVIIDPRAIDRDTEGLPPLIEAGEV